MKSKPVTVIRSEAEYDAALVEIEQYFDDEPERGTPEADRFDLLALVIADYEDKHWPIEVPDPISAIEFAMERRGLTRAELEPILGSRARVSEILARRRTLSVNMIRRLHEELGIPAEVLIRRYEAAARRGAPKRKSDVRRTARPKHRASTRRSSE